MEFVHALADFIIRIDVHLGEIIVHYGVLSYAILFAIVFAETGLVVTPFLPGDSLLFAAGALSAIGSLNVLVLLPALWAAAFLGDTVNYLIGRHFGQKLFDSPRIPINRGHLAKTREFYARYGGQTIFLARFVPIVRTFAPFVAGMGKMDYGKFVGYNAAGGFVWIFGFTLLGRFFGNIPGVKDNFSLVIAAIILLSVTPILFGVIRAKLRRWAKTRYNFIDDNRT